MFLKKLINLVQVLNLLFWIFSYCGICNTDTSRHHLPFPLPQVTGHEVVGYDNSKQHHTRCNDFDLIIFKDNRPVAVEINASHFARGLNEEQSHHCRYCLKQEQEPGIDRQCPERITLGIDRLPGYVQKKQKTVQR